MIHDRYAYSYLVLPSVLVWRGRKVYKTTVSYTNVSMLVLQHKNAVEIDTNILYQLHSCSYLSRRYVFMNVSFLYAVCFVLWLSGFL